MKKKLFWEKYCSSELAQLRDSSALRELPPVEDGADLRLRFDGKELLNLATNNYLGLSTHPAVCDAASRAAREQGTGSGASRIVTGNSSLYEKLEREIASFLGTESALVIGSGYAANLSWLGALAGRNTVVFSDRLNHASIVDGIQLSRAKHVRYRHCDMKHLADLLEKHRDVEQKILVTDSVFSMDGDCAPLREIVDLCEEHGVLLALDEAHASGIWGEGRGLAHALGLADAVDIHMGTMSKAWGGYGAYVAARADIVALVRNRGRGFVFSTSLPPSVIAGNFVALFRIRQNPNEGQRLLGMAQELREVLGELGFETGGSETQIIPVLMGRNEDALFARDFLLTKGVFVSAIRPPTVPAGTARLRLSLRADMVQDDLELVKSAFTELAKEIQSHE